MQNREIKIDVFTPRITAQQWFRIAKIISNEYIGADDFFLVDWFPGYYYLSTSRCDSTPFIRVYTNGALTRIEKIKILGEFDEDWREIYPSTYEKIDEYLQGIIKK